MKVYTVTLNHVKVVILKFKTCMRTWRVFAEPVTYVYANLFSYIIYVYLGLRFKAVQRVMLFYYHP